MAVTKEILSVLLEGLFSTEIQMAKESMQENSKNFDKDTRIARELFTKAYTAGIERCREITRITFESIDSDKKMDP